RGWRGPAARSRAAHGETGRARADLARKVGEGAVEGDDPEVVPAPVPKADRPVLALPVADGEHVGNPPALRLADPVAALLVPGAGAGRRRRCSRARTGPAAGSRSGSWRSSISGRARPPRRRRSWGRRTSRRPGSGRRRVRWRAAHPRDHAPPRAIARRSRATSTGGSTA